METNSSNKEISKPYQYKSNHQISGTKKSGRRWKKILVLLAIVLALGSLLTYVGISIYDRGYASGLEKGKKDVALPKSSRDLRSNLPFQPVAGKVLFVRGDVITVETIRKEKKNIIVGSTTKITKNNTTLSLADIKKDQKLTAFMQVTDINASITSRIIIIE